MTEAPRVLFVASEVSPFAKVGGLADVSGALPKALAKSGVHVEVAMPLYRSIDKEHWGLRLSESFEPRMIRVGSRFLLATYWQGRLPSSDVPVHFIDVPEWFGRDGVYDDPHEKQAWWDNGERFGGFCLAVLAMLEQQGGRFDIVHANDYQAALLPVFLKTTHQYHPSINRLKTLLTLHNVGYQGQFPLSLGEALGLPSWTTEPFGTLEFFGGLNMLKGGCVFADRINTVSETYAKETVSSWIFGFGLEGVLAGRGQDYSGIVNGVDLDKWNPENDTYLQSLSTTFSHHDLSGKQGCKRILHERFGLPDSAMGRPTIGIVSRLEYQKGYDKFLEVADQVLDLDFNLVVLGLGRPETEEAFRTLSWRRGDRAAAIFDFSSELAHLTMAGSDCFLMTPRYEPCGLNQIYALAYGTVPVVRATGGLADTVKNFDPQASPDGWGFTFSDFSGEAIVATLQRARALFADPVAWKDLMLRGMTRDFSWEKASKRYIALYREMIKN